jgi:photosystem II stability/assembly factor-like uncharacterized protein
MWQPSADMPAMPVPLRPRPSTILASLSACLLAVALDASQPPGSASPPGAGPRVTPWVALSSGVEARLRGVSAVSGTVAWASGASGTVLRTIDAGRTWQRLIVPDGAGLDFRDVDAIDERTAWVLSIGPGDASRIYRTLDGGAHWESQFVNREPKAFYDGMAFWDAEHGLAISDSVDGRFVIIRTDNGGRTWSPVEPSGLPPALPGEGAFAASGTSVAVVGRDEAWIGTGASSQARVLRSRDRGRTWTVATTTLPAGASAGIFSIAFADAARGIIVGGDYKQEGNARDTVALSNDGGVSWRMIAAPGVSGFRSAVAWLPSTGAASSVLAAGPNGSDLSRDGGRTWTPLGGPGFHALAVGRDAVAWAVGEGGRIGRLDTAALGTTPQTASAPAASQPVAADRPQTQSDDYTSYELLAPETAQFRILYDVTATTPGARYFFNPIRKGSEASDERVTDPATGAALAFEVVPGAKAREQGHPTAALDTDFIRVTLPRPVPANGEVRVRIDKTYKDAKSYLREGDTIVFTRSLGIKRNKIVLPVGYELVSCNVPSQILTEADGRIAVSFMNANPGAADLTVRARPLPAGVKAALPATTRPPRASAATASAAALSEPTLEQSAAQNLGDRAFQDREIVYFLQPPATHAFDLYHDYTEKRAGTATYVNVVRAGSRASNPSAINLDTGAALSVETLKGAAITAAGAPMDEPVTPETEIVLIRFPAVQAGQSTRLRISETYTDPARYGVVDGALVWRRSFGRPRNAMVLPAGWFVTASSMPATVSMTGDGRIRLEYVNARPDAIDVLVRARERTATK